MLAICAFVQPCLLAFNPLIDSESASSISFTDVQAVGSPFIKYFTLAVVWIEGKIKNLRLYVPKIQKL